MAACPYCGMQMRSEGNPKWADTPGITVRVAVSISPRNPEYGVIGKGSSGDDDGTQRTVCRTESGERSGIAREIAYVRPCRCPC